MNKSKFFTLPILALVTLITSFLFPRDGFATQNIESYEPARIVSERLWQENPVQLINTFFLDDTRVWGLGGEDSVSQKYRQRLAIKFGDTQIDGLNPYFEFYEPGPSISATDLELFKEWRSSFGYYTKDACPHNVDLVCDIGLSWNREITRTSGVELIFMRTGPSEYTFVDSTIVGSPGE